MNTISRKEYNKSWLDFKTSFYKNHFDKIGSTATFAEILFDKFADHLPTIFQIRSAEENKKRELKNSLGCFALNLLENRKKILSYSGLMQLDIDNVDNPAGLKELIGSLSFIAWVSLSCSGKALYAFLKIAEPERLADYCSHIFDIFKYYNIPIDTSKGRNYNDLRYVSLDASPILREDPTPLKIKRFYKPKTLFRSRTSLHRNNNTRLISSAVSQISGAQVGQRFEVVRRVSYTLGGYGWGLNEIRNAIINSPQYSGEEQEFLTCAGNAFNAGELKPFSHGNV